MNPPKTKGIVTFYSQDNKFGSYFAAAAAKLSSDGNDQSFSVFHMPASHFIVLDAFSIAYGRGKKRVFLLI